MRAARLPTVRVSAAATYCGQNSWHTLLKIWPSPNFVAGGNWYKYSLIFTNRMTNQKLRTRNFTTVFVYLKWKSCVRNHRNHLIWFVHLYVFLFTKDHFKLASSKVQSLQTLIYTTAEYKCTANWNMYKRQTFSSHRCIKYTAITALCRRISINLIFRHMRINITNGSQGEPNITFNFFRRQSHEGSCLLLVYFPRRKEGFGIRRRIHLLVPFWKCPYKKWNAKVSARA